jgi:predicted anti-sigma-YlaC factor YlaD
MTSVGFSAPACREIRQLLGVYVVGAIDPAERAIVDDHLAECQACRDELASLAGLPALLSRVPLADVERISLAPTELPEPAEPSPELLSSLVRRVSTRRRNRAWRAVAAVAAAAIVAAGGTTAVVQLTSHHPTVATEVASGTSQGGSVSAVVDYSATSWGTAMRVRVSGIPAGTTCYFWVIANGGRTLARTWTVGTSPQHYSGPEPTWYPASAAVASNSVNSFLLTWGSHALVIRPVR